MYEGHVKNIVQDSNSRPRVAGLQLLSNRCAIKTNKGNKGSCLFHTKEKAKQKNVQNDAEKENKRQLVSTKGIEHFTMLINIDIHERLEFLHGNCKKKMLSFSQSCLSQ